MINAQCLGTFVDDKLVANCNEIQISVHELHDINQYQLPLY